MNALGFGLQRVILYLNTLPGNQHTALLPARNLKTHQLELRPSSRCAIGHTGRNQGTKECHDTDIACMWQEHGCTVTLNLLTLCKVLCNGF